MPTTENEVSNIINKFKNKPNGLDSFLIVIYKEMSTMICRVIKVLFNQSIKLEIFSQCAEFSKIIPLYKSGRFI